jgi:DNA-nicking Smr family endonuclease
VTKKNEISPEENLFRKAVGQVKAVKNNSAVLQTEKPRPYPIPKVLEQVDPLQKQVANELETLYQEDRIAFISPGLQKNVLKKMRKGYYGVDAEIDLHGLTSREALRCLLDFLHHCVESGSRCVQIVHGKGYHSPENQPVLKNDINLWLRQHKDVLAFCSAPSRSGGAGALYVLLQLSDKFDDIDDEF